MGSVNGADGGNGETLLRKAARDGRIFLNPVPTSVGEWSTILKVLPQYVNNKEEKFPKRPLGPFRTDASIYRAAPASGLRVTWMGQWDERASPVRWAGPRRFFAAPLRLEDLPPLDVVLISHDHYDHLGESTIRALAQMTSLGETQWVTSLGVGEILEQYGVKRRRITELDWTESVGDSSLEITALPSRHFSGRGMFNRFETLWSSFVLKGPEHKVFFGADSGWWPGFAEIGAAYGPFDLTMLEIGAYNELWQAIHLGPDNAARAFAEMGGAGLMMPIHWGLFDLALHAWRQPIERFLEVADEKGIQVWSPEPGTPSEVVKGVEVRSDWWR